MKFFADENIPLEVVESLQQQNIDIVSISLGHRGLDDEAILDLAVKEKRTIITFDIDFSKLIFKLKKQSAGLILLRIHPQSIETITDVLNKVLILNILFGSSFCVVEHHRIRVIPLQ